MQAANYSKSLCPDDDGGGGDDDGGGEHLISFWASFAYPNISNLLNNCWSFFDE